MSPPRSPPLAVECRLTVTPFVQTSRLTGFMPPQTVPQAILYGYFSSSGTVIMELTDPHLGCRTDRDIVQLEMPSMSTQKTGGHVPGRLPALNRAAERSGSLWRSPHYQRVYHQGL